MTRLVLVEDRPGFFDQFRAEGLALVPTHDPRAGVAIVHPTGPGLLTVDLALPGPAGYHCITALGGGTPDIPILAVIGGEQSILDTALSSRLRAFVRRERALRLAHVTGWPSTLALSSREFDRLMSVIRRCGRFTMQPERQYVLDIRTAGLLTTAGTTRATGLFRRVARDAVLDCPRRHLGAPCHCLVDVLDSGPSPPG